MKTCHFCSRPIKEGYYQTKKGNTYCYDCYIEKLRVLMRSLDNSSEFQLTRREMVEPLGRHTVYLIERQLGMIGSYKNQTGATCYSLILPYLYDQVKDNDFFDLVKKYYHDKGYCGGGDVIETVKGLKKRFIMNKDFLEAHYFEL